MFLKVLAKKPPSLNRGVDSMIILEDTRQQVKKHDKKHEWFLANGIEYHRTKLSCGDYQLANNSSVAVDTKKDILELIGDIQVKQMSKKDIWSEIENILKLDMNGIGKKLYRIITDDDTDRFPEWQIQMECYKNGLSDATKSYLINLYIKRHGFFHRGLVKAKEWGVKLYILVENVEGVKSIDDLFRWVNPRSQIYVKSNQIIGWYKNGNPRYKMVQKYPSCMRGTQLAKACITMEKKYAPVEFVFCRPDQAGPMIVKLLTEGGGTNG